MATGSGFVKYNQPRQLRQVELLQDLNHWKDTFVTYFIRDTSAAHFLRPGVKWDSTAANYGIDPPETGDGARTAVVLAQDLQLFLANLAGFLPFDYVSQQIKDESFLEDISMVLNTGDVPNLFLPEEKADILERIQVTIDG